MKIHVLSDLHLEAHPFTAPATGADVIILAGDIHVGMQGVQWAVRLPKVPVIYVLGNHEYYHHTLPQLCQDLKILTQNTQVHILENDSLVINGVRFLGATLWTDFMLDGDPVTAQFAAEQWIPDYQTISIASDKRKLQPDDTATIHRRTKNWLTTELPRSKLPTVIVTHHAPSVRSIAEKYKGGDYLNASFASNIDDVVANSGARCWVHGHTHTNFDYMLGNTRVLCNPRGYPDEETGFKPDLTIEI